MEENPCSPGTTKIFVPWERIELATLQILYRSDVLTTELEGREFYEFNSSPGHENFLYPKRAWFQVENVDRKCMCAAH